MVVIIITIISIVAVITILIILVIIVILVVVVISVVLVVVIIITIVIVVIVVRAGSRCAVYRPPVPASSAEGVGGGGPPSLSHHKALLALPVVRPLRGGGGSPQPPGWRLLPVDQRPYLTRPVPLHTHRPRGREAQGRRGADVVLVAWGSAGRV